MSTLAFPSIKFADDATKSDFIKHLATHFEAPEEIASDEQRWDFISECCLAKLRAAVLEIKSEEAEQTAKAQREAFASDLAKITI